ncbi:MAG: hypothetical protein GY793_06320 [Proteobacteria bacterium]|nr:hypothetical protein [Pseudomonadota bacterium]
MKQLFFTLIISFAFIITVQAQENKVCNVMPTKIEVEKESFVGKLPGTTVTFQLKPCNKILKVDPQESHLEMFIDNTKKNLILIGKKNMIGSDVFSTTKFNDINVQENINRKTGNIEFLINAKALPDPKAAHLNVKGYVLAYEEVNSKPKELSYDNLNIDKLMNDSFNTEGFKFRFNGSIYTEDGKKFKAYNIEHDNYAVVSVEIYNEKEKLISKENPIRILKDSNIAKVKLYVTEVKEIKLPFNVWFNLGLSKLN